MKQYTLILFILALVAVSCKELKKETHNKAQGGKKGHSAEDYHCRIGKQKQQQSPINIIFKKAISKKHKTKLIVRYRKPITGKFKFNGHTWKLKIKNPKNYRVIMRDPVSGKRYLYQLIQLHAHVKSEHQINGKNKPFEIHFVHSLVTKAPKYKFTHLVIGILGDYNSKTSKIFRKLRANRKSRFRHLPRVVNGRKFFHYKGSLTTPPYGETVNWFVSKKVYHINKKKLKGFHKELLSKTKNRYNYRKTCKLHGRKIYSLYGKSSRY